MAQGYVSLFIRIFLETVEGPSNYHIKYDKINKRYVYISHDIDIYIFENEESLIEYLKFYFEIALERYVEFIKISLDAIKGESQDDYVYSDGWFKRFSLDKYHTQEMKDKTPEEKSLLFVEEQTEAIPKILDTVRGLLVVIKHGSIRNITGQEEINIKLFIMENSGQ